MYKIFFSSNIDCEVFKDKEKLNDIKEFKDYNIFLIILDKLNNNILIRISGISKLYNRKLTCKLESNDITIIKNNIEKTIEDEIKNVEDDLKFLELFLSKIKENNYTKNILLKKFKKDTERFINIMNQTYKNTYKISNGLYEDLIWKSYFRLEK